MNQPHLFAYGTLMCPEIFSRVTGLERQGEPGCLRGYRRLALKGEDYPAMIPEPGEEVRGLIFMGLSALAWSRLDRFEGHIYERRSVSIRRVNGVSMVAETYVLRDAYEHLLDDLAWDFEVFLDTGKQRFMQAYAGYEALRE